MKTPNKARGGVLSGSRLATPFFLALLVVAMCFLIQDANCAVPLNLTNWDINMSEAFGFSDGGFVGGVMLSTVMMLLLVFPTALIARKSRGSTGFYPELAMTILGLFLCVAIGWLHYWVLLVTGLAIALMFAFGMKGLLSGG